MQMILGSFIFSLSTASFDDFSRAVGQRWSSHERIGKRHTYQYLGVDEEEINLSGTIYPAFEGQPLSLDFIKGMAGKGQPYMLISGMGHVFGEYIIRQVEDKRSLFMDNGASQKIDFSIKLTRYDDDSTPLESISDALSG